MEGNRRRRRPRRRLRQNPRTRVPSYSLRTRAACSPQCVPALTISWRSSMSMFGVRLAYGFNFRITRTCFLSLRHSVVGHTPLALHCACPAHTTSWRSSMRVLACEVLIRVSLVNTLLAIPSKSLMSMFACDWHTRLLFRVRCTCLLNRRASARYPRGARIRLFTAYEVSPSNFF